MPKDYEKMSKQELVAEYRRLEKVLKTQPISRPVARGITVSRMDHIRDILKHR